MTPPPEFSEPRRSFVKKSLATTVSISFAGLIRASGEGTTETTNTTVWETTVVTNTEQQTTTDQWATTFETTCTTCFETTCTTNETTSEAGAVSLHKFDQFEINPNTADYIDTGDQSPAIIDSPPGFLRVIDGNNSTIYQCKLFWSGWVDHALSINPCPPEPLPLDGPNPDSRTPTDCLLCTAEYRLTLKYTDIVADLVAFPGIDNQVNAALDQVEWEAGGFRYIELDLIQGVPKPPGFRKMATRGISVCATGIDPLTPQVDVVSQSGLGMDSEFGIYLAIRKAFVPNPPAESLRVNWDVFLTFAKFPDDHLAGDIARAVRNEVIAMPNGPGNAASVIIMLPKPNDIHIARHQDTIAYFLPPNAQGGSCLIQCPNLPPAANNEPPLEDPGPPGPFV